MKTAIFYFTGTGNSLYSAKKLKESINGEVELFSIPKLIKEGIKEFDYDRIGFSFPLYFTGLPEIVERFIKDATFNNVKYSFVLTTTGITPGVTGKQVKSILNEKGISLNLNKWIYFTSNYIKKLKIESKEKISKKIDNNNNLLEEYANEINRGVTKTIPSHILLRVIGSGLYKKWRKDLSLSATNFTVNTECDLCGICSSVCPVDNICVDKEVIWGNRCQDCVACIHHCPKEAIDITGSTEGKRRYINPEVTIKEIINANS